MVMSVNTNISSLNAQKNLATSQSKLATAIARLSSGMRINSAKDDAAGLAISTRFTTQINGLNQAVSNANDGISLAQTTESALNEVTNNMQRIRTLAVQSANATNSDSDRAALDAEVQQRLAEITRISQQTTFNGRHVLDGSFGQAAFQIGANVGETISINLSLGAGASQVGKIAAASSDLVSAFAGTAATSASVDSAATVSSFDFANVAGTSSTANSATVGSFDFSDVAGTSSTAESAAIGSFNFADTAASGAVATANNGNGISFATNGAVNFTVDTNAVALTTDYADQATMVGDIQSQLDTGAGAGVYTVAASGTDGFTITTTATGSASSIAIGGADAGFIDSNVAGADAVTNSKNFTVDGNAVALTTDETDMATLVSDVQGQLDSAAAGTYTVSDDGGMLKIATVAHSTTPIAIGGADASFLTADAGGTADVVNSKNFSIDGNAVTLDSDETDMATLVSDVQGQLDAASAGTYSVSDNGGKLQIATVAHSATPIAVTGADASFIATNTAGSADVVNAKAFTIDGHNVALNSDDTDMAGLVADVQGQLDSAAAGAYTVSDDGGKLKIATVATGASASVVVAGADAAFFGTPVAGADTGAEVSLSLAAGDFSLNNVDITGTFSADDVQGVADAINAKGISGVSAFVDDSGNLKLEAQNELDIAGTKAGTGMGNMGFSVGTVTADGSLDGSNVKTVAGANDTINRIDSALQSISSMRSDLGAVQNRFDSTIANLQTISQNLSSSRSQIQDADFAAETANMSSANILQQAGVSVLAQANATTQSVLKLLQ